MCDKVISKDPFLLTYYLNRYNIHKTYDKIIDDFLLTLKFVADWFVTNKITKNYIMLYSLIMI